MTHGFGSFIRRILRFDLVAMFCLVAVSGLLASQLTGYVWWEAEDYETSTFPADSWFSASTFPDTRDGLSGGDWLTVDSRSAGVPLSATYKIILPSSGTWNLWVRKFWQHGPFRWRFDGGEWRVCGRDCALADTVTFRQHLCANWVGLGPVALEQGSRTFEIVLEQEPGHDVVAGFDCFVLVPGPFVARGKLKPDERSGKAEKGWFVWEPGIDPFLGSAKLDLRSLNEREAGESGFVRAEDGRFVLPDGRPVRFWGVNVGYGNLLQDRDSVDFLARSLSKKGVNAVRVHGPLWTEGDPSTIDRRKLEALFYAVHAFKEQGIYTAVSSYYPLWLPIKPGYGLDGYEKIGNKFPFGLIYFDPKIRSYYEGWMRGVFSVTNPWTGHTLADESAVAFVELVNEDSLFFWTFSRSNFPDEQWHRLETMFGAWLKKTGKDPVERMKEDDASSGRAGLYDIWSLTGDGLRSASPAKRERILLQAEFLAELQRGFYASATDLLRKQIGVKSLIVPSNWITADERVLGPIERWTYTAGDVMDSHGYFGGPIKGEGSDWSVRTGHTFEDRSGILHPEETPFLVPAIAGFPRIVSEFAWTAPNRHRNEAALFASLVGSLQDCGGIFWFAVGNDYLCETEIGRWPVGSPAAAGMFPAAALAFRGFTVPSKDSVHERMGLRDMLGLKGSGLGGWKDYFRGRCVREYADGEGTELVRNTNASLCPLVDPVRGLMIADTPAVQACAGFLSKTGPVRMTHLTVDSKNEIAAVLCVGLDGKDLKDSRRILIEVMTEEKMYGFSAPEGRIEKMGEPPFNIRNIAISVGLKGLAGPAVRSVTALDENGYPAGKPVSFRGNGVGTVCRFRLPVNRMYVLVER
jgi:hypothetical protein